MAPFIFIVAVIPIFLMLIILGIKQEKKRTESLNSVARELGMEFHAEGLPTVLRDHSHLRLFQRGRRKRIKNLLISKKPEMDVYIFGYKYTTGSGKNTSTHRQTVFSFSSPKFNVPAFELRPEHIFHKIGEVFGYMDIDFNQHPTFSKQYVLKGLDEQAVRDFFTPDRLRYLESQSGISIEAEGNRLIYYRRSRRVKPDELRDFIREGYEVCKLFSDQETR